VIKSTKILPAIASALKFSSSYQSPITFASPNLAELANIYEQAGGDNYALTSHPSWWETLDAFGLSSTWRMDLDRLARLPASESDTSKGKLDFLVERGVAQMAIRLLPFFKNLVIKCGERGVIVALRLSGDKATSSGWAREARSNPRNRFVLAHGRDELIVLKHYPSLVIPEGNTINVTGAGDSLVGALLADLSVKPDTFADPEQLDCAIGRAQAAAVLALQSSLAVSPELHTLGKI
jgi:pseudouridylate synthase / pseudouridine kinase